MKNNDQAKLEKLGLSPIQAQVYLALLRHAQGMGASALATAAGVPRPSVYPALESLVGKGMVENGEGYGSQFSAVAPEQALKRLIAAEKEEVLERLSKREFLATDLIKNLASVTDQIQNGPDSKLIEVLRDPRVSGERLQKLQREAQFEVNALVRPPMILKKKEKRGNPAEAEGLRRGIKQRVIYESSVLEHENIGPYLKQWIEAGEEARVCKGELPLKLILIDAKIAWMPLETDAKRHPVVSVLIRHHALGRALRLLFDYLWKESEPIKSGAKLNKSGQRASRLAASSNSRR